MASSPGSVLLISALMWFSGCGGVDVTGHWCGRPVDQDAECVGDETGLLLLKQDDRALEGQACEAHNHDCHVIERAHVVGDQVAFHYSFDNGTVDAKLSVEGDVMRGTFFASKCKCDLNRTFYRIP